MLGITATIALLWIALFMLPATRLAAVLPIALVVYPIYLKFKYRLPDLPPPETAPSPPDAQNAAAPQPPPAAARVVLQRGDALAALGYGPPAWWSLAGGTPGVRMHAACWTHPENHSTVTISCAVAGNTATSVTLEVSTPLERGHLSTVSTINPPRLRLPDYVRHDLPRIRNVASLVAVHAALRERLDLGSWQPPDPAASQTPLQRAFKAYRSVELKRGLTRFRKEKREYRLTWKGAFFLTWGDVWPWLHMRRRRVRREEDALLAQLGMTHLLKEGASNEPAPIWSPSAGLTIPDDRGEARAVARAASVADDGERMNPKVRAVVALSNTARNRVMAPPKAGRWGIGRLLLIVAASVGAAVIGLPWWSVMLGIFLVLIVLAIFRSTGKVHDAERAAADVLIRHGLCPCCLYMLQGLEAAADNCIQCPECGGAWRQDRIRTDLGGTAASDAEAAPVAGAVRRWWSRGGGIGMSAKDHRGKPCVLAPPRLAAQRALASGDRLVRLQAATKRIRKQGRAARWLCALLLFALASFFGSICISTSMRFRGGALRVPTLLACAWPLFMGVLVLRSSWGSNAVAIIRVMLEQRLCPSCAADLAAPHAAAGVSDVPIKPEAAPVERANPGACVACADCGAAWIPRPEAVDWRD